MKKIVFFLMAILLVALTACQLNPSESSMPESKQEESQVESKVESQEESKASNIEVPFEKQGFTVTFHKIEQEGNTVKITLTLLRTEVGDTMNLTAKQRFRLIAADKQITYLSEIYDMNGNSLLGATVETNEPIKCVCVFHMEEGFEPVMFRFVYDLFGFRYISIDW